MKRIHLIEVHDQDWCPRTLRNGETDCLQFVVATTKPYAAMVPILAGALQRSGLGGNGYRWEIGAVKAKAGLITITYLIGVPNENAA